MRSDRRHRVACSGRSIRAALRDVFRRTTRAPSDPALIRVVRGAGARVEARLVTAFSGRWDDYAPQPWVHVGERLVPRPFQERSRLPRTEGALGAPF